MAECKPGLRIRLVGHRVGHAAGPQAPSHPGDLARLEVLGASRRPRRRSRCVAATPINLLIDIGASHSVLSDLRMRVRNPRSQGDIRDLATGIERNSLFHQSWL